MLFTPSARILADSVSEHGDRLTTIEATMHRFVLAEFNTHRALSRNSASSRAIPAIKQLARYSTEFAFPLSLPAEQPGMSGGQELEGADREDALSLIEQIQSDTKWAIQEYLGAHPDPAHRLHKSVLSRYLEPGLTHTVIVSATAAAWRGFFDLRCTPQAQPETRAVAEAIREAKNASAPILRQPGEWHLPLFGDEFGDADVIDIASAPLISAARCARVSYLTHDGRRDITEDLGLAKRLADSSHLSPFEHVARAPLDLSITAAINREAEANYRGWEQLRYFVEQRTLDDLGIPTS